MRDLPIGIKLEPKSKIRPYACRARGKHVGQFATVGEAVAARECWLIENPKPAVSIESKFWSHVDKGPGHGPSGECWQWTGMLNHGYAKFSISGKCVRAARWLWGHLNGPIPKGLLVCHAPLPLCHNRACVNPSHLRLDTPAGNEKDKVIDGTQVLGERNNKTKLTEAQVRAIRSLREKHGSKVTYKSIGQLFGVSIAAIGFIVNRTNRRAVV